MYGIADFEGSLSDWFWIQKEFLSFSLALSNKLADYI